MFGEIQRFLGSAWTDFQRCFAESLQTDIPLLDQVNQYLLAHGGKKLRPTFTLLVAQALRGRCDEQFVIDCAVATELLHTATLVHDDVADDSAIRRGAPTVTALYSPSSAVLIGDFWLSRAVDRINEHPNRRVLKVFSKCFGDLAEGEMLQLEKAARFDTTEADYRRIIYSKTTSLFEASMLSAAYSVGATEQEEEMVRRYAFHIGQSFQMMDDILDYSPELSIGKPTGQDLMEKKVTLPLLCLFKKVPADVAQRIRERMSHPDTALVDEVFSLVQRYDALSDARSVLEAEIGQAVEAIAPVPASQAKDYLVELARMMAVRTA